MPLLQSDIEQEKVSIIMPTYNRAHLISETIKSIQAQTYTNWELLIIDDGSDDDTKTVIENIHEDRINFLQAGRTGIVGRLKNIAISQSIGNLIAFIDSDDLWHPAKLEKQVAALAEHPDADFCLVNGYNFQELGTPLDYFYQQTEGKRCDNVFINCFQSQVSGYTQALLMRRECLATAGNFKENKIFSDFEFIISLAHHFKAVILYEPLVFRRIHDDNYIHSTWEQSMKEGIEIINDHKHMIPSKIARDSLFRLYVDYGESHLRHKNYGSALKQFTRAWLNKPLSMAPAKKSVKTILKFLGRS